MTTHLHTSFRYLLVVLFGVLLLTRWMSIVGVAADIPRITSENIEQLQPLASISNLSNGVVPVILTSDRPDVVISSVPSRHWNLHTFQETQLPPGFTAARSSDSNKLILCDESGTYLFRLDLSQNQRLTSNRCNSATFSPDGQTVIISNDGIFALWDTTRAEEIALLSGISPFVNIHPVFSPDGQEIAIANGNGTVSLWDIQSRRERLSLTTQAEGLLYEPQGAHLITYDRDNFEIWNIADGAIVSSTFHTTSTSQRVRAQLTLSGNQLLLWGTPWNETVTRMTLWNVEDLAAPIQFATLNTGSEFNRISLSPDGRWLAGYSERQNAEIRIIDVTSGEIVTRIDGHTNGTYSAHFSHSGDWFLTAGGDEQIKLWQWDGTNAQMLHTLPGTNAVITPDDSTILTSIFPGVVLAYGVSTSERSQQPFSIPGQIVPRNINVRAEPNQDAEIIGLADAGVTLVGGRNGNYVFLPQYGGWVLSDPTYIQLVLNFPITLLPELSTDAAVARIPTPTSVPPTRTPTAIPTATFTPGPPPTLAVTATPPVETPAPVIDSLAIHWHSREQVSLLAVLQGIIEPRSSYPPIHGLVTSDSRLAVLLTEQSFDYIPVLWRLTDFSSLTSPVFQYDPVFAASPRGDLLAYSSGFRESSILLWDVATEQHIAPITLPGDTLIESLEFSPDGTFLLAIERYGTARIWDVETRENRFSIPVSGSVFITQDSQSIIATPHRGEFVRAYRTSDGSELFQFDTPETFANRSFITPDGSMIGLLGYDQMVLWHTSGSIATQITGNFTEVVVSPDSTLLATLDQRGVARLWSLNTFEQLTAFTSATSGGLAFSPDSTLLVTGTPLSFYSILTGELHIVEPRYAVTSPVFTPDGVSLLGGGYGSTMVFGIMSEQRPAWQPLTGRIRSSGVNVRALPNVSAEVIDFASGEVRIAGRAHNRQAVYLPDFGGWIWSDADYLDLGEHALWELPVLYTSSE